MPERLAKPAPGLTRGLPDRRHVPALHEVPGQARDGVERN
jgi:hypothetical protein